MSDFDFEAVVPEVERLWQHWSEHLGLQNWRVLVRTSSDMDGGVLGVSWPVGYRKVALDINTKQETPEIELAGEHLILNVLHETVHVAMSSLWEYGMEEVGGQKSITWAMFRTAQERDVDTLTSIIWRLHEQTGCKL